MNVSVYRSPCCKNILTLEINYLICDKCSAKYEILDNIPYLTNLKLAIKQKGVASNLFRSPKLYDLFIKLKLFFIKDERIGIFDDLKIESLLNVGCGSNINSRHLEYDLNKIENFYGTDISYEFVKAASQALEIKNSDFCVSSVESLPYPDNAFDVVFIPFVLHHTQIPFSVALDEAIRVSKNYVVVFDHIKSSKSLFWRRLQELYWNLMDGGYQYYDDTEWSSVLKNYKLKKALKTGFINKHVYKFVLQK